MSILFSVHNDDSELFCSYTILRKAPVVVVVTDSFIQPLRGDVGCSASERRAESECAATILGTTVRFLGIRDDEITDELFRQALEQHFDPNTPVYLPALQGGNFAHDIVSRVGAEFFKNVTFYATYAKGEHFTPLGEPVIPTDKEMALKNRALDCHVSQVKMSSTRPHFDAVRRNSEYLLIGGTIISNTGNETFGKVIRDTEDLEWRLVLPVRPTINALCELYGSDKCPAIAHSYAPFYDILFKNKRNAKTVLELGAGSTTVMLPYSPKYRLCASLYVWRDYFEQAEIYSLDVNPECNIKEERIHVLIGDQTKADDLQALLDLSGGNLDIIIDDCSHRIEDQLFSATFLLPHLKPDGIYCIEDIYDPQINFPRMTDEFGRQGYDCRTYEFKPRANDCLAVITRSVDAL